VNVPMIAAHSRQTRTAQATRVPADSQRPQSGARRAAFGSPVEDPENGILTTSRAPRVMSRAARCVVAPCRLCKSLCGNVCFHTARAPNGSVADAQAVAHNLLCGSRRLGRDEVMIMNTTTRDHDVIRGWTDQQRRFAALAAPRDDEDDDDDYEEEDDYD